VSTVPRQRRQPNWLLEKSNELEKERTVGYGISRAPLVYQRFSSTRMTVQLSISCSLWPQTVFLQAFETFPVSTG
jgi:hypothetical protein